MARVLSKRVLGAFYPDVTSLLHNSPATLSLNRLSKRFDSYKAAVLTEIGGPLTIEEKKRKKLKKGEVRVKVRYAGVNVSDLMMCKGEYGDLKPKLSFHPGFEISGEVCEVKPLGTEQDFVVGDKVVALSKVEFGGFAEECVVSVTDCWHLPSTVKYKQAAALAENYSTALISLSRRGHLKEKDKILILAGSGGLGLAAVDVAANVYRAQVIGVCDTEDRATLIRDKGAWTALTYDPNFMYKTTMEMTEKKGVKIAFDAVGGPMCENLVRCVALEGSLIVAGAATQMSPSFLTSALLPNSICLMGVSLRHYRLVAPNIYRQIVQDAIDMCEQKLIAPQIAKEFSLADVNCAFQHITDKLSTASVVIKVLD